MRTRLAGILVLVLCLAGCGAGGAETPDGAAKAYAEAVYSGKPDTAVQYVVADERDAHRKLLESKASSAFTADCVVKETTLAGTEAKVIVAVTLKRTDGKALSVEPIPMTYVCKQAGGRWFVSPAASILASMDEAQAMIDKAKADSKK
ncbi:MAG: hypothetical protein IT462_11320 [Planctomycetes bacterium]|nr:hypothetical protein [Planctomycetota bacterium]